MMNCDPAEACETAALRVLLRGRVQGLGVRPTVHRLAVSLGLAGMVQNTTTGVEIRVQGPQPVVAQFHRRLPEILPAGVSVESTPADVDGTVRSGVFAIQAGTASGPVAAPVPQDVAMCRDCRDELFADDNRRFRYPFTNCTQCGPRYSIIEAMPYERADTSMTGFHFCRDCRSEYESPDSRRFHAQTNACGRCGPQVWATDGKGGSAGSGSEAIRFAVQVLREGRVLGLKGLGGYQLLVDATSGEAVRRLRKRKHRPSKPLAVMVGSLIEAGRLAYLEASEIRTLSGPANPIVLVRDRSGNGLSPEIHPDLNHVGLMLPTTPLHAVLAADFGRPLVCTSGNTEGEPLCYREQDAESALAGICDAFLHHDRPIVRPIDDSVVRQIGGRDVTIRLARGLAPLPLDLPSTEAVLALGGHMKSAAAWSNGRQVVLGPHVGELDSLPVRSRLLEQLTDWQSLYDFRPARLIHDLHPDYFTTCWAEEQPLPRSAVQHHFAHVVAGMLEHGWLDRRVLGVAWDGTGYGPDGTIWGGEFLSATACGYERVARLRPFPLPGAAACIREPWRTAMAVVADSVGPEHIDAEINLSSGSREWRQLRGSLRDPLRRPSLFPWTSSAGRLFDAAANLILGVERVEFEGQAAMMLESVADTTAPGQFDLPLIDRGSGTRPTLELDWRPLFLDLLDDRRRGVSTGCMAIRFHRALASGIAGVCRQSPELPVVLCGGVFQNRRLTELVMESLDGIISQPVGPPGVIPPGDGGLAAGQIAFALSSGEPH